MSPQAQVAFLQGERKGQENLKTDLVRRIKMLEYALKQERWVTPQNSAVPLLILGVTVPSSCQGGHQSPLVLGPPSPVSPPTPPLPSRSKYHKLKFGTELTPGEKKPEGTEPGECPCPRGGSVCVIWVGFGVPDPQNVHFPPPPAVSNGPAEVTSLEGGLLAWKEGRQLLQQ